MSSSTMPPQSFSNALNVRSAKEAQLSEKTAELSFKSSSKYNNEADNYKTVTNVARLCVICSAILLVVFKKPIQDCVDDTWVYLRESPLFYSAYFETIYVTITYALVMIFYPYLMHHIPYLQKFKVTDDVTYIHRDTLGKQGLLAEFLSYLLTYLMADAFKMKKYWDVPQSEWEKRQHQWIQTTRALPDASPDVILLCMQIVAALFVFDLFFFFIHFFLHKNMFLYKYIHSQHHDHSIMHPHVTNQLSIIERILQVSSANYALMFVRCHPLTRVAFVPFYIWFLIENHTGYDLPWAPHHLMPRGIMGGPAKHHAHHLHGSRYYQPFFNYMDNLLERYSEKKKSLNHCD